MKIINMKKIILVLIPVLFIFSGIQNSKADTFLLYQGQGSINTSFGYGNNTSSYEAVGTFQLDKPSYKAGDTVYPSLSLTNFKNCMTFVVIPGYGGGGGGCTTSNAVLDSAGINNATTTYSTNITLKNRGNLDQTAYFGTIISYVPVVFGPSVMDGVSPIVSVNKIEPLVIPANTVATDADNNYDFILNVNFLGAPFGNNIIFDVPITTLDSCIKTTYTTTTNTSMDILRSMDNHHLSCNTTRSVNVIVTPFAQGSTAPGVTSQYYVGDNYKTGKVSSITCSPGNGFVSDYTNKCGFGVTCSSGSASISYTSTTTTSSTVDTCGPQIFTK